MPLVPSDVSRDEILVLFDEERDPVKNLAHEEELFRKVETRDLPELVRFWVNAECLVRGKAKSAGYGWYDESLAEEWGIQVVERSTGGGVVYHDEGNLNWSFFLRGTGAFPAPAALFDRGSRYVVQALGRLGVKARFSPPNRIDVGGRKVSGMAARSTPRAVLVHGTLLVDSNQDRLNMLCVPPPGCPPVTNLTEWVKGIDQGSVVKAVREVLRDSGYDVRPLDPVK